MSGKIESKQDSQRSHLSSFTMKLKDKFHSPKIKRTPSSKKTPKPPTENTVKTPEKHVNKNLSRLEEHEKDVVSALRYFKTIIDKMVVDKKVLEMLPGSASKVLEAVLPLVQVDPRIQHSSAVSSCLNRVYQSLGNLIHWSDQVMLGDEDINLDDKETIVSVTTVIRAVLDGVKELVKLTIEKQEHPSPTSPVKPVPPVTIQDSTPEAPAGETVGEKEKEKEKDGEVEAPMKPSSTLTRPMKPSSTLTRSTEVLNDSTDEEVAPPKPPLPGLKVPEHCPPALPPKKRQSAPSPTRVAVVAPMSRDTGGSSLPIGITKQDYEADALQRRFSGGSHSYGGESPRLSPCSSMGKLSKSDEQLSSIEQDSGQCSRNTSCETLDITEGYDPDYDFLHQDLSSEGQIATLSMGGCLSPLPESHRESSSSCPPLYATQSPVPGVISPYGSPSPLQPPPLQSRVSAPPALQSRVSAPPALPEKRRRSGGPPHAAASLDAAASPRAPLERLHSHYDNISEEEVHALAQGLALGHHGPPVPPFPLHTHVSPAPATPGAPYGPAHHHFSPIHATDVPQSPPPLPEKKSRHILKYMQFVEDYSEPQPSVFYQTPQSESIYEQRNKRFQEVYGFNDSFSSSDSMHEPLPPPALPPKQRQLASLSASPSSSSSSSLSSQLPAAQAGSLAVEGGDDAATAAANLSLSASNSSLTAPTSLDLAAPATPSQDLLLLANGSLESSAGSLATCLPSDATLSDTRQPSLDPTAEDPEAPAADKDMTESDSWRLKSPDSGQSTEEVDELSLIDHEEIMSRITLKQENDDGPDVRAGSGDILLVHATETDRKDLVLYCEAFLTTYRTFITPEDLIKKLHYRYTRFSHSPDTFKKRVSKNTFFVLVRVVDELCLVELTEDILRQLMDLVFRLVCSGELSLARVLRKNILDKVEQKKLMRYTISLQPLAARGVAARPGTLHDFRSHEIADQLTLLDAELFYKIEIPEVLLWAKEQNEEKSPNLTQFTEHFNNMSYWVRSIIILQEKAQDREKLLLKFIKIMKHLRKLNNFNSYLAILSALDSAPIRRLEWQKQTSEGLEEYCTLIDSSSSFRAYRAALAEVEPPCIPYLGLILQDLTFVHLGNPDLIEGKVNFSKRWQQFNILDSMRRFQQVHYDLKHNEEIVSFFNDFSDHLAEEALWELSLKIKPRNIVRRKTDREEKT
ncbi:rap guanine nucleotide exchange factor 1 isoform X1 [Alosa alosa]|uniref:rap guanine nucleotide exchange factor 1 isoform X1 n=1 Tax=Alosa alosa TaxID=278164 RepID=UPI00201555E6|nr:rap guanine nucleotide exchange factor 1 isoform X1 [Alosa alosa]